MTGESAERFLRAVARHAKTKSTSAKAKALIDAEREKTLTELVKERKEAGYGYVLLRIQEDKRPGTVSVLRGLVGEVKGYPQDGGTLVELAISDFDAWVEKKKSKK